MAQVAGAPFPVSHDMPRNASTGGPPSPQWSELSFPGRSDPMVHLSERNAVPLAPDAFLSVPYSAGNDHVDPDAIRKFQQLFHTLAVKSLQRAGIVSFCDRGDHKRLGSRAHGLLTVTRISHSETSRIMGRKRPIPQASKTGKRPKRLYGARKRTASTFHSITSRSLMRSAGCFHARMRRRIAPAAGTSTAASRKRLFPKPWRQPTGRGRLRQCGLSI